MNHEQKLERILDNCPACISTPALRSDGLPRKEFFEWMVAKLYRMEKELYAKEKVLALIRTREQTRKRKIFKVIPEILETEDLGVNL